MRKEDVNFKVLCLPEHRREALIRALEAVGISMTDRLKEKALAIRVREGKGTYWEALAPSSGFFKDDPDTPEVTHQQAMDILSKVQVVEPEGHFKFLPVDQDTGEFRSPGDIPGYLRHWQSAIDIAHISDGSALFAGYQWAEGHISVRLMGIDASGGLTTLDDRWVKPATPKAIRVWMKGGNS